jgi:hypothetical protein
MGYDLHIARVTEATGITLGEWLNYVSSDPEMRLLGTTAFTSSSGEVIKVNAPGLSEWIEPSTGGKVWFDHRSGGIVVKNPSREARMKMFRVAKVLGAIVEGDDGEQYDAAGNVR